ncbi:adenylate kinase family protein [Sulfolobus acidocaldarius]|uniref:Putative adenylate kinase n=4 Tax=Sulfolobus acidocaldarius TaxID=2285 RepID=Q4JBH4_SULAC|nr:adenylate kinase family protein [Sulfolobus acidocaldarius]AAY79855.1 conserved protein [Sulfolobus acidocaldarius DSM 639]AGE70416.1 putative adenylate kinase [Sulfolobus acidocaldarius N8]AGE72690.1 putative adenylate kinase [Sulfolobus acidocaldarius Ron12/I]ALU29197.1 adenylate kinase [Sulfolobus acidocaldarius]ALU31924.1 adenylate kinase [Sulfolobus acidocaldarius]
MIIIVAGTPGTGKTTVAKALSEKLNLNFLLLSSFIIENKAYTEYDDIRQSYIIDEDKVFELIEKYIENNPNVVIETIYPSLVPKADKIVVLKRDPFILHEELKKRNWNELKIAENLEAEILGVIEAEAIEAFGKDKVCSINNTGRTISQILEKIIKNECEQIDWLDDEKIQNFLLSLDKVISKYEDEKS